MKRLFTHALPALICTAALPVAAATGKPNIIFILADDLGYGDLATYNPNTDLATPHLDSLAASGIRFTRFYAASNVCSPSRRAIMTGRYPSRLGEWAEAYATTPVDNVINPKDEPCFPLFLKRAGYTNGMFGKWNIGSVVGVSTPDAQGFDSWIGSHHSATHFTHRNKGGELDFWENGQPAPQYRGQFADDVFIDKAIAFIKDNRDKPFFVYLSLFTPHAPFQDPADPNEEGRPDLASYNIPGAQSLGPPNPTDRPVLRKMTEHVDRRIGDLLKTLTDLGLEKNTLIIFTSDNGGERACINHPLTGFKQQMLEGGIRVPTLIKWPGVFPAGKVSDQPGISLDLTRTLLAAAGAEAHIPPDRELDGIDLTPILTGKSQPTERTLFWRRREWNQQENAIWAESCLQRDWKYLREFRQAAGFARTQQGEFHADGYLERLFNLKDDIAEQTNLAEKHPEKLAALRRELEQWRAKTIVRHRHYQIPTTDQYGEKPFATAQNSKQQPLPPAAGEEEILVGVNYFAGWWPELPNKWHGQGWKIGQTDWRTQFPWRVPTLGEYNEQATMDREIIAASSHGVDFFAILWYFPKPETVESRNAPLLNRGLQQFIASPEAPRMKFFIEYCNHSSFSAETDEQWAQCIPIWVEAMKHPSYLRVDGRLVFKVHGIAEFLNANHRDITLCRKRLDTLRAAVRTAGLGEMIIGVGISGKTPRLDHKWPPASLFDFSGTYMSVPEVEKRQAEHPYATLAQEARDTLQRRAGDPLPWMPHLAAGWNPRPWTYADAPPHYQRFFNFPTREEFTAELRNLKQSFAQHPNLGLPKRDGTQKAFSIYAWNEFGEGGIIAPSKGNGNDMLEAIRDVFGRKP